MVSDNFLANTGLGYERPFRGVDKAHVIQEARMFNDPNVEPARCIQLMTKLLYLLGKGENFSSKALLYYALSALTTMNRKAQKVFSFR